jgi:hypothetical protein
MGNQNCDHRPATGHDLRFRHWSHHGSQRRSPVKTHFRRGRAIGSAPGCKPVVGSSVGVRLPPFPPRFVALVALLLVAWFSNIRTANAEHDLFWYAYPMPQAYLYVQDPLRYSLWSAHYGGRQYHTPLARSPVYLPVMSTHDRSRWRRRECEIRILAGHRQ